MQFATAFSNTLVFPILPFSVEILLPEIEIVSICKSIIGASLSEPHIDGDVRPTWRGMFVSGRAVRLSSLLSREVTCARTH